LKSPRFVLPALAIAAALLLVSCKQGPVDYDKFERRTIEANLTAIDSASVIYHSRLAAGDIDAGAQQALAFLLTQPGVDSGVITADSTVWAFFSSGLLAGAGDIRRDTTGSGAAGPTVRACGGGEVGDFTHYVLPHSGGLPGTQKSADALRSIFKRKLGWENDETFKGSEVDLGTVLGLIKPGTSILFWSGHGALGPPDPYIEVPGLVLGKTYAKEAMAEAAVTELLGYLNPGPGQGRQAAVLQFVGHKDFDILLLPDFFSENADFNQNESLPINQTKTIVYLSCCYSCWHPNGLSSRLQDALTYRGADLVCGWTWEVGDAFACDKDTTFLAAMADTCLPWEAMRAMGGRTDPVPRRDGKQAYWTALGDSLIMLRAVCQVARDGDTLRSPGVQATRGSSSSGVHALLYKQGSEDITATVMITFPGDQPGKFNCASEENAVIYWMDVERGHTYVAMKGYVGVNGTISVECCQSDAIIGHFSGTLGWWDFGKDPTEDPPSATITLEGGLFKFTGKVTPALARGTDSASLISEPAGDQARWLGTQGQGGGSANPASPFALTFRPAPED